jgi:hypothetical protein
MENNQIIGQLIANWQKQNEQFQKTLDTISNEKLIEQIAPGRNSGLYLLGHIIALNDSIYPLLDLGDKRYPELEKTFIYTPDKLGQELFTPQALRKIWGESVINLTKSLMTIKPEEWLQKHTAVSEENFSKEPHRNKLNILITRMQHQAYHLGQLALLKENQ